MFDLVRPEDIRQALNGGFLPSADRTKVIYIRELRYRDSGELIYLPEYGTEKGRVQHDEFVRFDFDHFCSDMSPVIGTVNRPVWSPTSRNAVHVTLHPDRQWRKVLSPRARFCSLLRNNPTLHGNQLNTQIAYAMYFPKWYTAGQAISLVLEKGFESVAINKHLAVVRYEDTLLLSYDGMLVGNIDRDTLAVTLGGTAQHLIEQVSDHFTVRRAA